LTRSGRAAASAAKRTTAMQTAARVGFAAAGLVHVLIGIIALRVAFGDGGSADPSGALATLSAQPAGPVLLWVVVVALAALGLFLLLQAAVDRGTDKDAWFVRGKHLGTGIAYLAVSATGLGVARGGRKSSAGTTRTWSARVLDEPGGRVLLVVVALVILAIAAYFVNKGLRAGFRKDLAVQVGPVVMALGRVGYVAKGVALAVVGVLTGVAAITAHPKKSSGLDGALKSLADLPAGVVLLAVVAVGLIAYGVYFFVRARYARL